VFGRRGLWAALRPQALLLLGAGACMALYVSCWFLGIARIGAAVPTLIALCLPPVLVTLLAVARGRERLDAPLALALAAALGGTALVVLGAPGGEALAQGEGGVGDTGGAAATGAWATGAWAAGVAFSVASALLYAGFTLVSGRLSTALGSGRATTGLTLVAAAVMGLSALYTPLAWPAELPPEAWLLYLGLATAALALLCFNWGAARLSPTALTVATLVEPLTAVLLAALLLGQALGPGQWLGAALMVASIAALGRRDARRPLGSPA
jgi:DME family drug/metabolite transporter